MTFKQLFDLYLECHLKQKSAHWRTGVTLYNNYLQCFADREVETIRKPEIVRWQSDLANRISGSTANRTNQLLKAIFYWAIKIEAIPDYNPAARIGRFVERERSRFLSEEEIAIFIDAAKQLQDQTAGDFFLTLLFTCARKTNVLMMRWEEIDLDRAIWTIPVTKNGDSLSLPLIPQAMQILQRRQKSAESEWVFESTNNRCKGRRLVDPRHAWKNLKTITGLSDIRLHDLRRTLPSLATINGVNLQTVMSMLGHRSIRSTMRYQRLGSTAPTRKAMEAALPFHAVN
jgi:integrase